MKKVFVAAPISGFSSAEEYVMFRESVMKLISEIRKKYDVLSELESIAGIDDYDSPSTSVIEDTAKIKAADWFILIHPKRMQTSSLIELGYAYAMQKKIIIIGRKEDLPYMALGLSTEGHYFKLYDVTNISKEIIAGVLCDMQ